MVELCLGVDQHGGKLSLVVAHQAFGGHVPTSCPPFLAPRRFPLCTAVGACPATHLSRLLYGCHLYPSMPCHLSPPLNASCYIVPWRSVYPSRARASAKAWCGQRPAPRRLRLRSKSRLACHPPQKSRLVGGCYSPACRR